MTLQSESPQVRGLVRGVTLVEVLTASLLSLLVLTCAYLFLASLTRASFKGTTFGQVETTDVIAFNHLLKDLQTTSTAGVTWNPDVGPTHMKCVAIQPIIDVTNQGQLLYAKNQLIAYDWAPGEKVLHRRSWESGFSAVTLDGDVPQRLTPVQLIQVTTAPGARVASVQGVQEFDLGSTALPPNLSSPLQPLLVVALDGPHHKTETYRMTRTLVIKNAP